MLLLCAIPWINPFKNFKAQKIWNVLLTVLFIMILLFYAVDYYYYDYLQQRLNASILSYITDAQISRDMVWQTYPVARVFAAIILISIIAAVGLRQNLMSYQTHYSPDKRKRVGWYIVFFLFFAMGIFGKFGQFNLRWSDAFTLNDSFKANLSLNPFQSFFSTLNYRNTGPDINKVKEYYPLMADVLGVPNPDSTKLNFERNYFYKNNGTKLNVVLVICESFSMYKSSMSGNPFNTTPFFNSLCAGGVFFDRCFTPSYPTARGVWATVTAIPDVLGDNNRTASRNPEVVDQHIIMNDLKGYDKFYFLGGDPTWANIKGMLLNNIDSLRIYSQENFKAKKVDVWGIDDKNLFLEANHILAQNSKPFFAVIQTADNHPPYTIPAHDLGVFKKVNYPKDSLEKYGFNSIEQLNAFRYTDFCYQQFFAAAQKEQYFENTIFVFVGDHGIPGNSTAMYPAAWTQKNMNNEHVPLLFYAPKFLQPQQVHTVCSQLDIMPSVAHVIKAPYRSNAMGKNLFDSSFRAKDYAFIIDHDAKTIGIVNSSFYYIKNIKTGITDISSVVNNDRPVPSPYLDSVKNAMNKFSEAFYETSKYLLFNNKKKPKDKKIL